MFIIEVQYVVVSSSIDNPTHTHKEGLVDLIIHVTIPNVKVQEKV
jgi:hypothetical protein